MSWEFAAQTPTLGAEDEEALRHGLVSLSCWPDLSQVPQAMQPLVARVCALLGHRPSAGMLIPTILSVPRQEVFSALAVLARLGHVKVTVASQSEERSAPSAAAAEVISLEQAQAVSAPSAVTRLWSKLRSLR